VAVSPEGLTAYIANQGGATVSLINTVTTTITVGSQSVAVAFTPNGATAYVTNPARAVVRIRDYVTVPDHIRVGVTLDHRRLPNLGAGAANCLAAEHLLAVANSSR